MIRTVRSLAITALVILSCTGFAFAGASTGDITVDSTVGTVTNYADGNNVNAETNVHSVDVKDGGHTGDITITGKAGEITNVGMGNNVNAVTNVGSVKVGD